MLQRFLLSLQAFVGTLLIGGSMLAPGVTYAGGAPVVRSTSSVVMPQQRYHWQVVIAGPMVHRPTGLAIDLRGNPRTTKWAYVPDIASGRIVKFGTGGRLISSWAYGPPSSEGQPVGIAVGGSGNVFIADPQGNQILKYSAGGNLLARWTGFRTPRAVAVDHHGTVYVAESSAQQVTKLAPDGTALAHWRIPWEGKTASPKALAVDRAGNVYVAATCYQDACTAGHGDQQDEVLKLSPAGMEQGIWIGETPHGGFARELEQFVIIDSLTTDQQGNWYVAGLLHPLGGDFVQGVLHYSPTGSVLGRWFLPGRGAVNGIAVDGKGVVYVVQGRRVVRLVS